MIMDVETLLSNAQSITGSDTSDVYDLGAAFGGVSGTPPMRVHCSIPEAFNTLTSLDIALKSSAAEAMSNATTHWTRNVTLASGGLAVNSEIKLPDLTAGMGRYIRFDYTVNGGSPSTGQITLGLVLDKQDNSPAPDAL